VADPDPEVERAADRSAAPARIAVFSVLWALAALFHLAGGASVAPTWSKLALVLTAGLVLWRPGAVVPLGLLAAAGIVVAWEEAPVLGNHWLLAALVDLAILLSIAVGWMRGRLLDRVDLAERLFPPARLCLLGLYAFAWFAKVNHAFLDRRASCAVVFYRETTSSIGLQGLQLGGTAWVARAVMVGTVVVELAIPLLLLNRRTRSLGVLVGLLFHSLLALDHRHELFDFSAVTVALLFLFLPPLGGWAAERVGSVRARLALRGPRLPTSTHALLVLAVTVAGVMVATATPTRATWVDVGYWAWQIAALVALLAVVRHVRQGTGPVRVRLRPHHALFAVVPLLVVLNGVAPYLELKTATGWNMYSNLRTVDGDTNHLLLPRSFPVVGDQADTVLILSSDDPSLARYRAAGYALTWRELRSYLSRRPAVAITFVRDGKLVALQHARDLPELVRPVPTWQEKLLAYRPIDRVQPERCLTSYGPAR